MPDDGERAARVALSMVAAPADPAMGTLLESRSAAQLLDALASGAPVGPPELPPAAAGFLAKREPAWRARAAQAPPSAAAHALRRAAESGARLVIPGEPEWPEQLDSLGPARPYLLWVRGLGDLRNACLRSVSIVGARAASDYGRFVAGGLGCGVAERGWSPVSGGAYGVDAAAHRGALAAGAPTVAVLACGPDVDYPRGHGQLFAEIARQGVLITELPPGRTPTKQGFLIRNRLIAALTPGTVVVEAGHRSGAMNTARHAWELNRQLMAVPGQVTSASSAGCHDLLRDWQAVCVTDAAEVIEQVGQLGGDLAEEGRPPLLAGVALSGEAQRVLDAVPARTGAGPARVAAGAGCGITSALRQLGLLAAAGFVERTEGGWRRTNR